MGIIKEFKDFIMKGNVIDLAVGIIIGGAFGTVVKSLVDDVIMPPLGQVIGGIDFSDLKIPLGEKADGSGDPAAIMYGNFINNMVTFLIVGAAVFLLVKVVNKAQAAFEEEKADAAPAEPSEDILLLREIRDSLKK